MQRSDQTEVKVYGSDPGEFSVTLLEGTDIDITCRANLYVLSSAEPEIFNRYENKCFAEDKKYKCLERKNLTSNQASRLDDDSRNTKIY